MGAVSQLEKSAIPARRGPASAGSKLPRGPLTPLDRSSDERLARRAIRGDEQALGVIFERYQQELYRFCLGLLSEPQDAQDALQNTMVKALRALPGETREIALRPWLYRIAHNEAINLHRAKRETQTLDRHLLDGHSNIAETAEHRERLQWLLRDLGDLPERQRAVLVMRELSGLDFADIGAALGTSGAVVRQALYEARRNLEQMDFGRSLRCEAVARVLSDADGRVSGRREIRAHLRDCPDCRHFQERIQARKEALAGIAPLPAGVAAGFLQSISGGSGGSAAGGLAAALGGGAAKQIGTVGALKAIATVAAVAVVGSAAVERNMHDHRAARDAATPSLRQDHPRATLATESRSPRRAPYTAHRVPAAPPPVATSVPPGAAVSHRSSPDARKRTSRDQAAVPEGGSLTHAPPVAGKSPSPLEATRESSTNPAGSEQQSKLAKQVEKQEEKAEREEKKAAKAEAKGHPEHPEHPAHPAQSQKPTKVPGAPEEGAQEAEAAPTPEAEAPTEPTVPGPKGKAKGHGSSSPAEPPFQG
jgi:RNA polymerase sigma factor (sigma-70 family)